MRPEELLYPEELLGLTHDESVVRERERAEGDGFRRRAVDFTMRYVFALSRGIATKALKRFPIFSTSRQLVECSWMRASCKVAVRANEEMRLRPCATRMTLCV